MGYSIEQETWTEGLVKPLLKLYHSWAAQKILGTNLDILLL
jgi:hypothetical protein